MSWNISRHASNILAALTFAGIGNGWIAKNCRTPLDTVAFVETLNAGHREDFPVSVEQFRRRRDTVVAEFYLANHLSADGIVALGETDFPLIRGSVPHGDQPVILFYKGDLSLLGGNATNVAVIGLLDPDQGTLQDERQIVSQLVARNIVIVSGLAHGCDAQAHRTALEFGGRTIAVLPSTLSEVIPSDHKELAKEIVACGGLLITEYWSEPSSNFEQTARYIKRDRLQALFSDMVLLVSSYSAADRGRDSGSRHAIDAAKKYGIPRGVFPDRSPRGPNPKYNLNREIFAADANIVKIHPDMIESLEIQSQILGEARTDSSNTLF